MKRSAILLALLLATVVVAAWAADPKPAPAPAANQSAKNAESDPDQAQSAEEEGVTSPELERKIDAATDKALAYIAKLQKPDGSWEADGVPCAAASVAIMAFLAKGHQPGEGPYGDVLNKAIDFVISKQNPNGLLAVGGRMYAHGMCTLMLGEVLGQTTGKREEKVRQALALAVKLILDAQKLPKPTRMEGGWRYQATSRDSDLSVTGWQLMALRSAKNAGADVPAEAIEQAVKYVQESASGGGGFGYQPGGSTNHARAGTGILCLELCGKHNAKEALASGDWILANPYRPYGGGSGYIYYTMYYCSQAMFQLGGKYWRTFWPSFAQQIIERQQEDGSFPRGASSEQQAGPAYSTGMAVLALSVRYRLLPIYQR
ncbi:MAG: hypothetical protein BIFFINMI_03182 [Phycisphaerae bacterium]|nr:hypothetical protein [Phycisphaerae bacterium]